MTSAIAKAIDRALDGEISPWKLCRPAGNFQILSVTQMRDRQNKRIVGATTLTSQSVHNWTAGDDCCFELAVVPILAGQHAYKSGLSIGSHHTLQRVFQVMNIPTSVITCFLDNRIQFTTFPGVTSRADVHLLNFRQWAIAWHADRSQAKGMGVLLWMGGTWAAAIANRAEAFLKDISCACLNSNSVGVLGTLLCASNVAESLAALDVEAFRTERRLRELIQDGQLKSEDELGRMSAAHSWLASRAIRERQRLGAASAFLDYVVDTHPQDSFPMRHIDNEALQMLMRSLTAQTSKLSEESAMHLSTIYNLIAQKDQATNLAIAAASRGIALQAKIDQANSLEIADASKRIAEEAKKDSNAMKMIAIVTMVYLPGTFVATCFSMDLFQWNDNASRVVNPRIWVYFLITGFLTLMTIGSFVGWLWYKGRRIMPQSVESLSNTAALQQMRTSDPDSGPQSPPEKEMNVDLQPVVIRNSLQPSQQNAANSLQIETHAGAYERPPLALNVPPNPPVSQLHAPTTEVVRSVSPFRHNPAASTSVHIPHRRQRSRSSTRSYQPSSRSRLRSRSRSRSLDRDFRFGQVPSVAGSSDNSLIGSVHLQRARTRSQINRSNSPDSVSDQIRGNATDPRADAAPDPRPVGADDDDHHNSDLRADVSWNNISAF